MVVVVVVAVVAVVAVGVGGAQEEAAEVVLLHHTLSGTRCGCFKHLCIFSDANLRYVGSKTVRASGSGVAEKWIREKSIGDCTTSAPHAKHRTAKAHVNNRVGTKRRVSRFGLAVRR